MTAKGEIRLTAKNPPVVELDSEAHAAYVRFSSNEIVRTHPISTEECVVTVDLDKDGEVVGIELIGVSEFGIGPLLEKSGVKAPSKRTLGGTRYVPASLQTA